jgi:nitrogen fixation NifU-like protein
VYSERLLTLFRNPAHVGTLADATHYGEGGVPGQGPYVQLWLRLREGRVKAASFKTYGCPAAIACSEALCESVEGRILAELRRVDAAEVTERVGGVPEGKEHCPELAAAALRAALEPAIAET